MALTATDRSNLEAALILLARGLSATQVSFSDGHSITYKSADAKLIQALIAQYDLENSTAYKRVYAYNGGRSG